MVSSQKGMPAPPKINGETLARVPPEVTVRQLELKSLTQTGTSSRETRPWWPESLDYPAALMPQRRYRHSWTLGYPNTEESDRIAELMAPAGPHEVVLWKPVTFAYAGKSNRTELYVHYPLAGVPPTFSTTPERFNPLVKVAGVVQTYVLKTAADYSDGSPTGTEVWFNDSAPVAKLAAAPAPTDIVTVRLVPVLQMFRAPDSERSYQGANPLREPVTLALMER